MGMGGVERQILLTVEAVRGAHARGAWGGGMGEVAFEAVLFQEEGEWGGRLRGMGVPVRVFRVWESKDKLGEGYEGEVEAMVQHLRGFDVAHTWYGGGAVGTFSTFAAHAARLAGVPVVQSLAWSVVTVDLTVAVVVVECDETEELHRGGLEERGLTSEQLTQLGVSHPLHQALIREGAFLSAHPDAGMASSISAQLLDLQRQCRGGSDTLPCLTRPSVVRVNPGLDLRRFDPQRGRLAARRAASRGGGGAVVIGRVSRLVPEKDPEMLIRAAEHFAAREDVRFKVWGEGEERARLEGLIEELGLGGVVQLMGATDDVEGALSEMDIFAYPTTGESVGWVILEAMAMGLPVVSTAVGAVPTFVRHMETGMLLDPLADDAAVLAGVLEMLVEDRELRERLGAEGRRRVLQENALERFGAEYGMVYQSVARVDWKLGR